jgi:hypothetical protein
MENFQPCVQPDNSVNKLDWAEVNGQMALADNNRSQHHAVSPLDNR